MSKPDLRWENGNWVPKVTQEPAPVEIKPNLIFQGGKWVPEEVDFSAMEMVKNLPGDAGRVAKEAWEGIKAVPEIAALLVDEPGLIKDIPGVMWDDMVDSYGGVERFQRTLMERPAQVILDMAGLTGAAGLATKLAGKGVKKMGEGLYSSTSKFSTTLPVDEKKALVRSAMDRGVSTTEGGASKLSSRIKKLNNALEDIISGADPDDIIPIDRVLQPLKQVREELGGMNNIDAAKDLAAINKIEQKFRDHAWDLGRDNFTVRELQEFKKNLYKTVKFNARSQKGTMAGEKTRKAAGRGAKEAIEEAAPGVSKVNKELSDLYELQPHVERAASRLENRNFFSLPAIGMGGMGGLGAGASGMGGAGSTGAALLGMVAASTLMHPAVTQGAGRAAYKLGNVFDKIPAKTGLAAPFAMPGQIQSEDDQ